MVIRHEAVFIGGTNGKAKTRVYDLEDLARPSVEIDELPSEMKS